MQSLHWPSSLQWYDLGLGFKSNAVHAGAGRMLDHQISAQWGSSEITGTSLQKACQCKRCCREHSFHAEQERSPVSQVPVIKWNIRLFPECTGWSYPFNQIQSIGLCQEKKKKVFFCPTRAEFRGKVGPDAVSNFIPSYHRHHIFLGKPRDNTSPNWCSRSLTHSSQPEQPFLWAAIFPSEENILANPKACAENTQFCQC